TSRSETIVSFPAVFLPPPVVKTFGLLSMNNYAPRSIFLRISHGGLSAFQIQPPTTAPPSILIVNINRNILIESANDRKTTSGNL
ncbi:MAG: hypothetical protein QF792_06100, partial [Phycisphaerae bacterium]|nr:hypothetical protein [Phycisphaerae bacterium]